MGMVNARAESNEFAERVICGYVYVCERGKWKTTGSGQTGGDTSVAARLMALLARCGTFSMFALSLSRVYPC